jgi:phage-related protein
MKKQLIWVGSSEKDFNKFPTEIKETMLHAFQKKSKRGIATPKKDLDMIERRLKTAQQIYKENFKG